MNRSQRKIELPPKIETDKEELEQRVGVLKNPDLVKELLAKLPTEVIDLEHLDVYMHKLDESITDGIHNQLSKDDIFELVLLTKTGYSRRKQESRSAVTRTEDQASEEIATEKAFDEVEEERLVAKYELDRLDKIETEEERKKDVRDSLDKQGKKILDKQTIPENPNLLRTQLLMEEVEKKHKERKGAGEQYFTPIKDINSEKQARGVSGERIEKARKQAKENVIEDLRNQMFGPVTGGSLDVETPGENAVKTKAKEIAKRVAPEKSWQGPLQQSVISGQEQSPYADYISQYDQLLGFTEKAFTKQAKEWEEAKPKSQSAEQILSGIPSDQFEFFNNTSTSELDPKIVTQLEMMRKKMPDMQTEQLVRAVDVESWLGSQVEDGVQYRDINLDQAKARLKMFETADKAFEGPRKKNFKESKNPEHNKQFRLEQGGPFFWQEGLKHKNKRQIEDVKQLVGAVETGKKCQDRIDAIYRGFENDNYGWFEGAGRTIEQSWQYTKLWRSNVSAWHTDKLMYNEKHNTGIKRLARRTWLKTPSGIAKVGGFALAGVGVALATPPLLLWLLFKGNKHYSKSWLGKFLG